MTQASRKADELRVLAERMRACANGVGSFKTDRGDFGLCDEVADVLDELRARAAILETEQ